MKKILPALIYGVSAVIILTLLMWYGSVYDYAYKTELGGGTSLSALFLPSVPFEPQNPKIIPEALPEQPEPQKPEPPVQPEDPDLEPEIPLPEDLLDRARAVYESMPDELTRPTFKIKAEFDTARRTARLYAEDSGGILVSSDEGRIQLTHENKISAEMRFGAELIAAEITVYDRRVIIRSIRLCEILDYENPIYPGELTLDVRMIG